MYLVDYVVGVLCFLWVVMGVLDMIELIFLVGVIGGRRCLNFVMNVVCWFRLYFVKFDEFGGWWLFEVVGGGGVGVEEEVYSFCFVMMMEI